MEGERVDTRLLPRLVKGNWNSEFKEGFREYALTCGEVGEIIVTRGDMKRDIKSLKRERRSLYPNFYFGQRNKR
jgi:hypothetical protein